MRIAILGLEHETNTFLPGRTTYEDFVAPGGWPPLSRGEAVLPALEGSGVATAGAVAAARTHGGVELVPILWTIALPGATVAEEAFARLMDDAIAGLKAAHAEAPLDGVFAEMHGAMVSEAHDHAEAHLAGAIRAALGPDVPLAVALDLHGNISDKLVDAATLLEAYRTYPHVDMKETGARAMRRLIAFLADGAAPQKAVARPPFQIALTWQCTLFGPGKAVVDEAEAMMAADPDLAVATFFGFPLADIPGAGPAIVTQHPDAATARSAARRLGALWDRLEPQFDGPLPDAPAAIAEAMQCAMEPGRGPVVIADTQDNPGGGGPGDTTGMLAALLAADAPALLVHIADADACAAAHAAGLGATIDVALGGRALPQTGAPIAGPWIVAALGDGRFVGEGPMYGGNHIALGPVACLTRGNVRVIVAPKRMQASEPALPKHLGQDPFEAQILVVKSSVHFRGAYQDRARRVIVARAPGPVTADLADLPARRQTKRAAGRASQTITTS
ncbi:M81 family metallopeptidase [Acuticoccus sp. I52.16.1]|uniref:M81 family metallopeptidase n=1 Tax=Acuticoccus sp. I52.16.1 TaxID=2928472 RepID=UPI001FD2815A|nr:M81 family metallopeptidase [Acuticoccus sp. I52.16.1]UOM35621.1 M81 family metallopeptidase [Acuticoccus sp. I52.16.1]